MKKGAFITLSVLLMFQLVACGKVSQEKKSSLQTSQPIISENKNPEQKKSNVLIIGGRSEPFSSIIRELSSFDPKNKKENLSMIWEHMDKNFKSDFENEPFFTVVNRIEPKTNTISFGSYFGLDTSLSSLSRKGKQLTFEPLDANNKNYQLLLGNFSILMNWNPNEKRVLPQIETKTEVKNNLGISNITLQKSGQSLVNTTLPLFEVSKEDLPRLTNLTLNLSEEGYADPIHIKSFNSAADLSTNCFILSGWKVGNTEQTVMLTNFLDLPNNEIRFSNLEIEKLRTIKNISFGERTGTSMVCTNLQRKSNENPYNTTIISTIPINMNIIESNPSTTKSTQPIINPTKPTFEKLSYAKLPIKSSPIKIAVNPLPSTFFNTKNVKINLGSTLPTIVEKQSGLKNQTTTNVEKKKKGPLKFFVAKKRTKSDEQKEINPHTKKIKQTTAVARTTQSTPQVVTGPAPTAVQKRKTNTAGLPLQINHLDPLQFPQARVNPSLQKALANP